MEERIGFFRNRADRAEERIGSSVTGRLAGRKKPDFRNRADRNVKSGQNKMNDRNIEIREQLKKILKPSRFEHTLGVCYTASALAMRWGADLKKAETAGLLHDCAKCYDNVAIVAECRRLGIELTADELAAPAVIHAKLGAWKAEHEYGIQDPEVLSAIANHTTGKPGMSLLDKIVYIADYIEPGRKMLPRMEEFRVMAFTDLDEAFYEIQESILDYLRSTGSFIDSNSLASFEYCRKEKENALHG